MKSLFAFALVTCLSIAPISFAADVTQHDGHHPETPAAKPVPSKPAGPKVATGQMMQMDSQMNAMRAMHDKMMVATTAEARNALMAEHMIAMQDGMSTMSGMMGGKAANALPLSPQMMQKKMEMMQMMMQMMMDRMTPPTPAK